MYVILLSSKQILGRVRGVIQFLSVLWLCRVHRTYFEKDWLVKGAFIIFKMSREILSMVMDKQANICRSLLFPVGYLRLSRGAGFPQSWFLLTIVGSQRWLMRSQNCIAFLWENLCTKHTRKYRIYNFLFNWNTVGDRSTTLYQLYNLISVYRWMEFDMKDIGRHIGYTIQSSLNWNSIWHRSSKRDFA